MKLILSTDVSKVITPEAELMTLSQNDRLKLTLKKFLILFLSALVAILIPVLHFFLVPLLLVLSFVLAYKAYATRQLLVFKKPCTCVECQTILNSEIKLDESLRVKCQNCLVTYLVRS